MNLVWFLTIGTLLISLLGEFGKFPFGSVGNSINLLDLMVGITVTFFLIWKIGITKQIDFPKHYLFLISFIIIGFFSLVVNQNLSGVSYLIRFALYSTFFWISYSLAKENRSFKTSILLLTLSGAVLGGVQLFLYPNLTFLTEYGYDPHINRLAGTFLDPNFLGAFLNFGYIITLIYFIKTKDYRYLIALFILLIAIVLTFSRSAWLMMVILNLFSLWLLPKRIIAGVVVILILSGLLIPRVGQRIMGAVNIDISASERFGSWGKGGELFRLNPIFGIGFNNIRSVSVENSLIKPSTPDGGNSGSGVDSSWVLIFATTGIIGGGLFSIFYFKLVWSFLKYYFKTRDVEFLILSGLLVAFFIQSQFINSLFYPPIMLVFFLLTGSYYAKIKSK